MATPTTAHLDLKSSRLRYRAAFALIITLLLFILVLLPFSVTSMVNEVFGQPDGEIFSTALAPRSTAAPTHTNLHVSVIGIDATQRLVTLLVSGHHTCQATCPWSDRVLFFSIAEDETATEGLPPSASVTLPPDATQVTQSVQLPVHGQPIHYPFDTYELRLGVVLQRVASDGAVQTLSPSEATGHLFLTLQERLPRQTMTPPTPVASPSLRAADDPYEYLQVVHLAFTRPVYFKVLVILLLLLITASAAYAVFMRPLHDLIVNSGALMLGVWGIRSILAPDSPQYATAVNLSLSMVLLFLLGAITVRALWFVHERAELHILNRHPDE